MIQHGIDEIRHDVGNPVVVLRRPLHVNPDLLDISDPGLTSLETLNNLLIVPFVQSKCGPPPELGFINKRVPGPDSKYFRYEFVY